jgi:hypothetical protein
MKKLPPSPLSAPVAGFNGKTFYADAQKNAESIAKAETLAKKRAAELLAIKKKQQALEGKILKDKKLAALIDKSNALLNKGEEVFDLDKIQIAAALTSQAEALGKTTSAAQVLQIANDTARLNVKRSILALEDAIQAKDEAAIIAATEKLNEDLKVLNALTGQKTQMESIESILKGLAPKDLINQANLDEALRKIEEMLRRLNSFTFPSSGGGGGGGGGGATTTLADINKNTADLGGVITVIGSNGIEYTPDQGMLSGISPGGREYNFSVTVNTGIGDPNAIAEAIDQVITDAVNRGSLRGGVFAA